MNRYPKIQSIFKRHIDGPLKGKFTDEYSLPEFEYLKDNQWVFTEKIDGTNIRVAFEEGELRIGGRTNRAQIPSHLYEYLHSTFVDYTDFAMTLFGEGYGVKIQNGGNYIPDGVGFILFDVQVGQWWLKREDVVNISQEFGIPVVPIVGRGTLAMACDMCKHGYDSNIGTCVAEGVVARPAVELKARNGERIITKVKVRDFR